MKIKFNNKSKRAGMISVVDDETAKQIIANGFADEVKEETVGKNKTTESELTEKQDEKLEQLGKKVRVKK